MTEKNAKIKLGIVGTGRIAMRAVREIMLVDDIKISAVFNPNTEHAKEFVLKILGDVAKDVSIEMSTDIESDENKQENCNILAPENFEDFLDSVDAVYIATPHGTHFEYASKALQACKDVICEKPMTLAKSQAKELCEIAKKNSLVLMEAIKTEHCPGFKEIEKIVVSGLIGEVADVEACFTRLTEGHCREFDDIENGGAFTEFGSYPMLPILRFLGTEFEGINFFSIPYDTGVDGYTKALFRYKDKVGTAKTGLTVKSEGQLVISGTKGYILVPSPWWLTRYFEVRFEDPSHVEKYNCEFEGDGLRYEFKEFARRVRQREIAEDAANDEMLARAEAFEDFLAGRK